MSSDSEPNAPYASVNDTGANTTAVGAANSSPQGFLPPHYGNPADALVSSQRFYSQDVQPEVEPCCSKFWKAPFRLRNYRLILATLFIHAPFAILAFVWVGSYFFGMFAGMTPMIVGMIVGPPLTILVLISWQFLRRAELSLQQSTVPENARLREFNNHSLCFDLTTPLKRHNLKTWEGFWSAFKDLAWRWSAWKPALYFLLIKPIVVLFNFCLILVTVFGGLALIFNFAVVAACTKCTNHVPWVFGTYEGSVVTIPSGLLLFFFGCYAGSALTKVAGRLAVRVLLGKPENQDLSSHPPVIADGQSINFGSNADQQNSV